jgi:hypothetical protein
VSAELSSASASLNNSDSNGLSVISSPLLFVVLLNDLLSQSNHFSRVLLFHRLPCEFAPFFFSRFAVWLHGGGLSVSGRKDRHRPGAAEMCGGRRF